MWMKLFIWAIIVGSLIMGYLGYQSGSATNAAIGIGAFIVIGFALFFLLKLLLHFGFFVVKVILIIALFALLCVAGFKGCQSLFHSKPSSPQVQQEEPQTLSTELPRPSFWKRATSLLNFSKKEEPSVQPAIPIKETQIPKKSLLPETVSGKVTEVRSGYLFRIGKHFIKLYGIDAPDPSQQCLDKNSSDYNCGQKSKMMLERLILNKNVSCKVAGGDFKKNYIATCKIKDVDVGASMLSAGWGVADRKVTQVYTPYEEQAHKKKKGLWAGKFVAPWQARSGKVQQTAAQSTTSKKGFWENLFK